MAEAAAAAPDSSRGPRTALVLFAAADEPFVRGFLLPAIGTAIGPDGQPVALEARDPLTMDAAELDRAMYSYAVVVAVISAAFLADPWTRASEMMATDATKGRPELAVVPLVLEDVVLPTHISYRMTLAFQDRAEWDHQAERLRSYLARPAASEPALPCPYPGMRPFQAADARYFHGRSTELSEIRTMITAGDREIYLVGPSGSGKSSLIYAGLLPQLAEQPGALVVATMRPGDAPLRALAACLEAPEPTPAAAIAGWATRHPDARLVVFVDQLEELFAQAPRAEQLAFAAALAALRAEPRCVIVLALRADFYGELQLSELWTDAGRRHVDLPPLRGAALREAIVEPARTIGVYLETALTERLLADAAGEPGVLPLLQETLVQLWGHRLHCLLTRASYDALGDGEHGGLAVAVTTRADRCLAEMTAAQAALARLVLLRLVNFGEGRPNTRRRQTRSQLAAGVAPAAFADVLSRLIDARLVTVDQTALPSGSAAGRGQAPAVDSDAQVDLCHEVLITAWPSFASWIESRRADEQRRRHIQDSAEAWIARGRGATGLLDAAELATAVVWRTTDAAQELGESAEVTELIDRSRRALTRARWLRRIAIAAVVVVVLVIGRLIQMSATASGEATLARAEQLRELGRQELVDGHTLRAMPLLLAARELGLDDVALRLMFHAARPNAIERTWPGRMSAIAYSPDGKQIALGDQRGVTRRDAATGAPIGELLPHPGFVLLTSYTPDASHLIAMVDKQNTVWLWDLTQHPATSRQLHHDGTISFLQFSPDGTRVVTASADHTVRLWDTGTGAAVRTFDLGVGVRYAELNRDNTRLAVTLQSGTAVLWDAATGKPIDQTTPPSGGAAGRGHAPAVEQVNDALDQLGNYVLSARFSPDGTQLVTTSGYGRVELWWSTSGLPIGEPIKLEAVDAMFSPDGRKVLTVGRTELQLLDYASHERVGSRMLAAPTAFVRFSADGTRVLVVSDERSIWLWTPATDYLDEIELAASPNDAEISPDASHVTTAGDDAARLWSLAFSGPRVLAPTGTPIYEAAYSPDGKWLVTSNSFGVLTVRTADGAPVGTLDIKASLGRATFSAAGDRLLFSDDSGVARVIELSPLVVHKPPGEPRRPGERGSQFEDDKIYGHPAATASLSADGHRIAMLGDHYARVWDADTGLPITPPLPQASDLRAVQLSPDASRVATACQDGTAQLWDARTGARIGAAMPHAHPVFVVAFSPDGRTLAVVSTDASVTLWDLATQRPRFVVQHTDRVIAATFSPDGAQLMTYGLDHVAKVLDVATGQPAIPELRQSDGFQQAAFSPDGTRIMTVGFQSVQLWDAATGRMLRPPLAHPQHLFSAAFSPDGNALVTTASDGVRIWDVGLDDRPLAEWRRAVTDAKIAPVAAPRR